MLLSENWDLNLEDERQHSCCIRSDLPGGALEANLQQEARQWL